MTREQLEDYHNIVVRLKSLRAEVVTDSVKGSMDEYPFTSHSITLHGVRRDDKARQEEKLLVEKKNAIEGFIDGITDVRAKTIVELHIKHNLKWPQIGRQMGESPDAVRMCYYRIFQNK